MLDTNPKPGSCVDAHAALLSVSALVVRKIAPNAVPASTRLELVGATASELITSPVEKGAMAVIQFEPALSVRTTRSPPAQSRFGALGSMIRGETNSRYVSGGSTGVI